MTPAAPQQRRDAIEGAEKPYPKKDIARGGTAA
jgi:hypothetical protein